MPSLDDLDAAIDRTAPVDPLDVAIDGTIELGRQKTRASLYGAVRQNPDEYAKAKKLERKTGLPAPLIARNLPEVQQRTALDELDTVIERAPILGQHLQNPDFANLAHDDSGNLSDTEALLQGRMSVGKIDGPKFVRSAESRSRDVSSSSNVLDKISKGSLSILSAVPAFNEGAWGVAQAAAETGSKYLTGPLTNARVLPADIFGIMGAKFAEYRRQQGDLAKGFVEEPGAGPTESAVYSGLQSLGLNLMTAPIALETQSAKLPLLLMGGQTAGQSFGKARDQGKSLEASLAHGGQQGIAEYVTEKIPANAFVKSLDKGYVKATLDFLWRDVLGEQAATVWQDFNEWANLNPEKSMNQFLDERPDAAYQTLIATLVGGGGSLTLAKAADLMAGRGRGADQAQQNTEALNQLTELAKVSKLRERDPQSFQQFIDAVAAEGPVQDIYISAQTLAQSGKVREIVDASPSVAAQIEEALQTGGDIRIPVGEYAASIAGKHFAQDFNDHVKTEPGGMTQAEASTLRQSQDGIVNVDEMIGMVGEQVRNAGRVEQVQAVEQQIVAQLDQAGRFSPTVNRAYAALPTAFFDTMSQRLGVTPSELWASYGANISAESVTGPMLSQPTGERGGFVPKEFTKDGRAMVGLFKHADLSTFLHESGHWFLESYADMAKVSPVLQADMQTVLNWFGVQDLSTWQSMTLEQKRTHHEQFARGFEAYLYEGKAPSLELQGLFSRFRAWLARVYRDIKGLNVELNDEVRAVLDRMLAVDSRIEEAQAARAMQPLFKSPEKAAEYGVDWQQYQALGRESTDLAMANLEARSMRDMTFTSKLRAETVKRLNRDAADKRKEVRREVEAEVAKAPVYTAMRWLKRGEMTTPTGEEIKAEAGHRLSIPVLRELYPESAALDVVDWERLGHGKYGMLANEGLHPDLVAEMFGFQSGDALVRELITTPPMREVVEGLTDQRMLEQYGDLSSPEAIGRAADAAIHNDARARFLATELAGLQKAVGGARVLAKMAKDYAEQIIERARALSLRPAQYAAAGVRAGKAAEAALKRGDTREAVKQKRFQLIQHATTRAAYDAKDEVQKTLAGFRAIADAKTEQLAKTHDLDIANTARAILAGYGVGMRGKNPRQYMEAVRAYDPELFAVLEPTLLEAEENTKPLDALTVGELRALRDNIESLWHLARRTRLVEIDGQLIDRQQIAQQLVMRLDKLGVPRTAPGEGKAVTEGEKRMRYLMGFRAALRHVEGWVDRVDGGDIKGSFRRFIWQPISEAADAYRADAGVYLKRYRDLLKAIEPGLKPGRIDAPELGYTFGYSKGDAGKAELLHAILHTGNESNQRKLLLGRGWATDRADGSLDTSRWDAFTRRMVKEGRLTKADYDFAQGVWDLLEQTKPLAQKTHREVFGRYFDEVTAQEFSTPFGAYRGGYVPAIYDTFEVQDAAVNAQLDALNSSNAFMFPATSRGFTKGRVEYNRPLALDLRLLPQHLDKVLLFAHLEPRVRDTMRTLRAKGLAATLNRFDPTAYTDLLLPWLNRAAKQTVETPATGWAGKLGDRFFRSMRSRAGMAAMFANTTNALQQFTGLSITALKVKPAHLKSATWRYMRAPAEMAEQVALLSPFMANRQQNETMRMRNEIDALLLNPSAYEKAQDWTARHAYFLQSAFQNVVDTITWSGAYDQALAAGHSETDAIRAANSAVRETQGSLQPEDISRFESGPAFARMFTQFQSYFNMQANLLGTEFAKVTQDMGARKGAGRLFYIFLFGFLVPAWFSEAIVQSMRGGPGDDDEDGYLDEFLNFFFGAPLRNAAAMVPIAGQASMLVANTFNRKPYDDRMSTAPAVSMIESAASAPHSVYKAIAEEGKASRAVRDTLTLVSLATGIPVAALGKPLGYAADVAQGRVEPTGPLDAARGAVSGAASPESRR